MIQDPKERTEPLEHLHCLVQTLLGMSESYVPVERMCRVINAVIRESGWDVITHSSESDNGPVVPASSPSSRRKSASNDNPQKQLSAGALPPADPSPLTFERQSHSENFSNAKQFPGCEIGSVGPPQIVSRPEDMTGSAVDSFLDPVFFTNDWEIMDTQLDRRDEGSGIGGRTVVGLDLLDLDFGITSGQNFRSSERPGDLPDFWGTILRQLGTSV
jgi:hypothetical protein